MPAPVDRVVLHCLLPRWPVQRQFLSRCHITIYRRIPMQHAFDLCLQPTVLNKQFWQVLAFWGLSISCLLPKYQHVHEFDKSIGCRAALGLLNRCLVLERLEQLAAPLTRLKRGGTLRQNCTCLISQLHHNFSVFAKFISVCSSQCSAPFKPNDIALPDPHSLRRSNLAWQSDQGLVLPEFTRIQRMAHIFVAGRSSHRLQTL